MNKIIGSMLVAGMVLAGSFSISRAMTPEEYFDVDVFVPLNFREYNQSDAVVGDCMKALIEGNRKKLDQLQEDGIAFIPLKGAYMGDLDHLLFWLAKTDRDHLIPHFLAAIMPAIDRKMPSHAEKVSRANEWLKKSKLPSLDQIIQDMEKSDYTAWVRASEDTGKDIEKAFVRINSKSGHGQEISAFIKAKTKSMPPIEIGSQYLAPFVIRDKTGVFSLALGYTRPDGAFFKDDVK